MPQQAPPCNDWNGTLPLTQLGVIRAQGADAAKFLHGQLTQDFVLLGPTEARLAAFCSPKGRMLASFVGFKLATDDLLLVCPRDVLPATLKRLTMFVMRAQCKLSDASDGFVLCGVAGPTADALAQAAALGSATWAKTPLAGADGALSALVRLPSVAMASTTSTASTTRLLACVPTGTALESVGLAPTPELAPSAWDWLEVASGVALVTVAVTEAFVPQMLNYESVGGVSFKKGCYPGQEVVARSQFRGTLKRRTFRVACEQPLAVGQEVFHSSDSEQACGTVVAAAQHHGQTQALVSMVATAAEGGQLNAAHPQGPPLQLLSLPYALLADV